MNIRALQLAAVLSVALASTSMASLVGVTYTAGGSASGETSLGITSGTYTSPTNVAFCAYTAAFDDACVSSGLYGSVAFADTDSTDGTITFNFTGSSSPTGDGSGGFTIELGNFATTDGSIVTGVSYASGNLADGSFNTVSFDGTTATFTGTSDAGVYDAVGGQSVVFDVTLQPASAPEPASIALFGSGLIGLAFAARKRLKA